MVFVKQSTAVTLLIGPFVDSTDGNTAETALTIAQADVRLSKNGGNMAQKNDATGCTHDELGYYTCPLDATDTNTLGILKVMVHESGALPVWTECMVVTANVYDTLCSTDQLDVNVTNIEGVDATNQINAACDTALTDYDAATGTELSTVDGKIDTIDTNVDAILVDTGTTLDGKINTIDANVDAALADTNELQGDWTDGGRLDLIVDAILADTNELQTDDIPGAISGLNDPTAAAIADAVWDEAATGHTDAGKAGQQLWTDVDAILSDTNELQTDDIPGTLTTMDGKLDTIETDTNELQTDDVPGLIAALNDPTAAAIATAVLGETVEGAYDLADMIRLCAAALLGDTEDSGLSFRDLADAKDRFTVTISTDNRNVTIADAS